MRIVIHDWSGHAFPVQLSRSLAGRGHCVLHLYASFFQSPHGVLDKKADDPDNIIIEGVSIKKPFQKYSFIKRRGQEIEYGKRLAARIAEFAPEFVVSANAAIDPQSILLKSCAEKGIKFVLWAQDINSLAIYDALKKKLPFIGRGIGRYYEFLERRLFRQSDGVILISEDFVPLMNKWGVDGNISYVMPNWAPLDELPSLSKINTWSKQHALADKFCIMYSGTLGLKHNPELLLELALSLKDNKAARVVVISEGLGADWLTRKKRDLKLENLILMSYQPFEQIPSVLASADILAAILGQNAGAYSVPSKVLTYLCIGKPLLLAVCRENQVARLVSDHNMGFVVSPADRQGFVDAAAQLMKDEDLRIQMGKAARNFAEQVFDINRITDDFEKVLSNIVNPDYSDRD
jgi:glycosyltransferase involved in cell wall biosynthesis